MDISSVSAVGTSAPIPASAKPDDRLAKALELSALIDDDSGKHSVAEKAAAWDQLFSSVVTGSLAGVSDGDRKLVEHALGSSTIAQRMSELQREHANLITSAATNGGSSARATVNFYDGLSSDDKLLFADQVNTTRGDGTKRFDSIEGWRTTYLALGEYDDYNLQAQASGLPQTDPKFTKVQALFEARNVNNGDAFNEKWGQAMLDLLRQSSDPVDRVQLSDVARARLGEAGAATVAPQETQTPAAANAYGSLLNTKA